MNLTEKLKTALTASCKCITKTNETAYHQDDCPYMLYSESIKAITTLQQGRDEAFNDLMIIYESWNKMGPEKHDLPQDMTDVILKVAATNFHLQYPTIRKQQ